MQLRHRNGSIAEDTFRSCKRGNIEVEIVNTQGYHRAGDIYIWPSPDHPDFIKLGFRVIEW